MYVTVGRSLEAGNARSWVSPGYSPGLQVAWRVSSALPHGRVGPSPPACPFSGLWFLLTILWVSFPEGVQQRAWGGKGEEMLLGN